MAFHPVDPKLLFTRNNPQDPRLGELVNTSQRPLFTVFGYADDEGISLNGGRSGAKEAPRLIRENLYKMTPPLLTPKKIGVQDMGDLDSSGSLESKHQEAQDRVTLALENSHVLTLGGGHDFAYPDGSAFLNTFKERPLIINFDAHLDVRPTVNGQSTSGTPFFRLLEEFSDFDFLEIGIQSQCNSSEHYEWALKKGAKVLSYEELLVSGTSFLQKMLEFLEPYLLKKRPTYVSIDMDCMSSAFAPGCSQVFATGFSPLDIIPALKVLFTRLDVRILGIYEVSPPYDSDNRTSKLAAQLAYEFLFSTPL